MKKNESSKRGKNRVRCHLYEKVKGKIFGPP